MHKNIKKLLLLLPCILLLAGCGKKQEPIVSDLHKVYQDNRELKQEVNDSCYIMTTKDGYMALYDYNGKQLDEIQLENSTNSDYIYCSDSGDIFSQNILKTKDFNCMFYAVDRNNGRLFIVKNKNNSLKMVHDKTLKESTNIEEIKAYNGMFYYMVKGYGIQGNSYTIAKSDSSEISGLINNKVDVPIMRRGKTYTYVYAENFKSYYLDNMDLSDKLSAGDITNMNLPDFKKDTFKIPYNVDSWTITNNEILFCASGVFGKYDMVRNIIEANYGTENALKTFYIPGRYSRMISINQFGENSEKTIVFCNNVDTYENIFAYEMVGRQPIDAYVDDLTNILYVVYKEDSLSTYGKLKIIDLSTLQEINAKSFDFVPTKVAANGSKYFVFNEYEDFYITGDIHGQETETISKYINGKNANDILICKTLRKDYFLYDANGRYIDEDGKLLDYRGNLINEYSQKINRYGQLLDDYGRAVNSKGELIDKYGNIIDENGVIIKYVVQKDGYCRSKNGKIVDETGKAMIEQEDGTYIKDIEEIPELEWHFDENGDPVVNADYLAKYPDAESWIRKDGSYTAGVSVISKTNDTEKEELQQKKSLGRKFTDKIGLTDKNKY